MKPCIRGKLVGQRFGRLLVAGVVVSEKRPRYRCQVICDCGTEKVVCPPSLLDGMTKSCGCLNRERITKHGLSRSAIYQTWRNMKIRCFNKTDSDWHRYGGRGITVCARWMDFRNFVADMGVKPAGLTLERINNDGNYEPGNCRWATPKEQAANKTHALIKLRKGDPEKIAALYAAGGISMKRLGERFGVTAGTVFHIVHRQPQYPVLLGLVVDVKSGISRR